MAITLFERPGYSGRSLEITRDWTDLSATTLGKSPSSLRMDADEDVIALFGRPGWRGPAMIRRGRHDIPDLGDADNGGKTGFREGIESVRVTRFTLRVQLHLIHTSDGDFPAGLSRADAESRARKGVAAASLYFREARALIRLRIARVVSRESNAKFNLSGLESAEFPDAWSTAGLIDVAVVNRIEKEGTGGRASPPCSGGYTIWMPLTATIDGAAVAPTEFGLGGCFAHELGHYLGLGHEPEIPTNLMFPTWFANPSRDELLAQNLRAVQLAKIHEVLANDLRRRADR